ncbi:hypothetical protein [Streptomyces syringium]
MPTSLDKKFWSRLFLAAALFNYGDRRGVRDRFRVVLAGERAADGIARP